MRLFGDVNSGRQIYFSERGKKIGDADLRELFRLAIVDAERAYAKIVALGLTQKDWEYLQKAAKRIAGE